mmetsp:Transcript_3663/g.5586  ORF Transcript_3663/g.5586 Transcript_3663/m.5586 type:complete len:401 (+) Transcript_3663:79-1281(+)
MLRQILRHVQNALVLSAVLLVILAFQRLRHYEVQSASFGNIDETSSFSSSSTMIEQDETSVLQALLRKRHNPVKLGSVFRFGLSGFFGPAISDENDEVFSHEEAQQQQLLPKEEWRIPSSSSLIQYIVDFGTENIGDLCADEEVYKLDAARVLRHSLVKKTQKESQYKTTHVLYSIFYDEKVVDSCNVTKILKNMGYHVVSRSSIEQHECIHEERRSWEAYAADTLNADLVIHIPVTAVVIDKKKQPGASERSANGMAIKQNRQQRSLLSSSVYSSSQSIQFLWKKPGHYRQLRLANNCSKYESPITCHSSPCQISKDKGIVVPPAYSKCRMPWMCSNNTSSETLPPTASSSSCRSYHHIWTQERTHLLQLIKKKAEAYGDPHALCQKGKYNTISLTAID